MNIREKLRRLKEAERHNLERIKAHVMKGGDDLGCTVIRIVGDLATIDTSDPKQIHQLETLAQTYPEHFKRLEMDKDSAYAFYSCNADMIEFLSKPPKGRRID